MKDMFKSKLARLIAMIVVGILFLSSHSVSFAQGQLQKYRSTSYSHESAIAQVIEVDDEGNGVLRIYEGGGDCADCFVDAPFGSTVSLNTPLGHYYGLDKLADWSDRSVLVKVSKETGQIVMVRVLSNN